MKVSCSVFWTLCNPVDCSSPGFSVNEILQARILAWVAIPSSRVYSQPREWTQVSCIAGGFFIVWATRTLRLPRNFDSSPGKVGTPQSAITYHENLNWQDFTAVVWRQHYHHVMEQADDDQTTQVDAVISAQSRLRSNPSPREMRGS